ncbi:MAG: hypothetical protein WD055_02340 [Candidatus Dependentiae bacterium]
MQQIIVYTKKVFVLSFLTVSAVHAAHLSRVSRLVPAMQRRSLLAPGLCSQPVSSVHQKLLMHDQQRRNYNVFDHVNKSVNSTIKSIIEKKPFMLPVAHGLAATAYGIGALGGVPIGNSLILGSMASVRAATCMALLSDKPVPRAVMSASNTGVGVSAFVGGGISSVMFLGGMLSGEIDVFLFGVGLLGWTGSELGLSAYTADYLKRVKPEKKDGKLNEEVKRALVSVKKELGNMLLATGKKLTSLEKEDILVNSKKVDMKKD